MLPPRGACPRLIYGGFCRNNFEISLRSRIVFMGWRFPIRFRKPGPLRRNEILREGVGWRVRPGATATIRDAGRALPPP